MIGQGDLPPTGEVKECCAAFYEHDAVALLLGASFHPGGLALTRHLARGAEIVEGSSVLDLACGPGSSALLLADEFGARVDGVDLGLRNLERATAAAAARGLTDRVRFHAGDAEHLAFADDRFDVVIAECAFCTFPDKPAAAAEMARVVRPGGRVAITDVTVDPARLDASMRTLSGWIACLADARPLDEYAALFVAAGLEVAVREAHDAAVHDMIDRIEARIGFLDLVESAVLAGIDTDAVSAGLALARRAVTDGHLGYGLLVARRPDE